MSPSIDPIALVHQTLFGRTSPDFKKGLLLLLVTIPMMYMLTNDVADGIASEQWTPTKAEIISLSYGSNSKRIKHVNYAYKVGNLDFSASTEGGLLTKLPEKIQDIRMTGSMGSTWPATAYVDPQNPQRSRLVQGIPLDFMFWFIMAIVVAVLGFAIRWWIRNLTAYLQGHRRE
jgi:hypothetical protein